MDIYALKVNVHPHFAPVLRIYNHDMFNSECCAFNQESAGVATGEIEGVAGEGTGRAGGGVDFGWWTSIGKISVFNSLVFFCLGSGAFSFSWT